MGFVSSLIRLVVVAGAALLLSGCISFDFPERLLPRASGKHLEGAAAGARYESFLSYSDRRAVEKAALAAVEDPEARKAFEWDNPSTGSFGSVRANVVYLIGFNAGAEIEAPLGLDTSPYLEPGAGDYITTANTNVRLSPSLKGERSTLLPEGSRIKVIALEPVNRWYLIAHDSKVIGYVFADLIVKTEGGDLLLAGGDQQVPKLCREVVYKMNFKTGKKDEWLNGACREGGGEWTIVGGRALEEAR